MTSEEQIDTVYMVRCPCSTEDDGTTLEACLLNKDDAERLATDRGGTIYPVRIGIAPLSCKAGQDGDLRLKGYEPGRCKRCLKAECDVLGIICCHCGLCPECATEIAMTQAQANVSVCTHCCAAVIGCLRSSIALMSRGVALQRWCGNCKRWHPDCVPSGPIRNECDRFEQR
jgi:hypothetical protein